MRLESLKRHWLLVVVILILPHVVPVARAALAPVAEIGHLNRISRTRFQVAYGVWRIDATAKSIKLGARREQAGGPLRGAAEKRGSVSA